VVDQIDVFQPIQWNVIACDEGHKLNNNATQAHKAIAALQARQKLIITGSPMQNGAREMWALLNLTVPGLLKDRTWFNQTFPKAKLVDADMQLLEANTEAQLGNTARLQALGKIVSPFFLRRTNKDLGRQLPPVQVIERHVVMEQDQADVYEAVRASGKREAIEVVQAKGLNHSRLEVLTQINRLRQVCCDPSIVTMGGQRSLQASSAKRAAIREICAELVEDGRKIVITSEWNRLLDNIATDLKEDGIEVVFVTGDLTGLKRKQAQEQFRTGKASVMLIQLTLAEGIELPEGDAIIICEPWWNRKKEEQAIARLRRDERDKHINVIRLLVAGSVENGVVRVAQSKLDDIEAVQAGHAAATGGLSLDDIDEFFRPLEKSALAEA
jgi:SNF2 family DNA or RNA helicase